MRKWFWITTIAATVFIAYWAYNATSDERMIARRLGISWLNVKTQRFYHNKSLGDFHIYFYARLTGDPAAVQRLKDDPRSFGPESRNPLIVFLPFRSQFKEEERQLKWWQPPEDRSSCIERIAVWPGGLRVNLIICDKAVFGFAKNRHDEQATSGPF